MGKVFEARYPGQCRACGGAITPGQRIEWSGSRDSRHVECPEQPLVQSGAPRRMVPKSGSDWQPREKKAAPRPRLPELVGERTELSSEFEGTKLRREPAEKIGEAQWLRDRGQRIAVVLVGYAPARWVSRDMLDDNDDFGVSPGFYGVKFFRRATVAEFDALQAKSPRPDAVRPEEAKVAS